MAVSKKKVKRTTERAEATRVRLQWRHLHIGFEGDGFLTEPGRQQHVMSARRAIEETFKASALQRWTNQEIKKALVPLGEGHARALALLMTNELNAGVRRGAGKRFTLTPEDQVVVPYLATGEPVNIEPDIKPDGTQCYWHGSRWIDVITFLMMVDESGPGAATSSGGARRAWKPDGHHGMIARLSYNCPYELLAEPAKS